MSPTKRTKKTESAKAQASPRAVPVVPDVVSVPPVSSVPTIDQSAATGVPGVQVDGNPDEQSTARIPKVPGSSIVEQAQLAREETQPLPVITSEAAAEARKAAQAGAGVGAAGAAMAAGAAGFEAGASGKRAAAQRPSVKAKVEKQRAAQREVEAKKASSGTAAGSAAAGDAAVEQGADGTRPSASSRRARVSTDRTSAHDADVAGESRASGKPSGRGILRNPDGTRPLWIKIAVAVLCALVALVILVAGVFVWIEWGHGDDAADIQGSWVMEGGTTPIEISQGKITLSKDAAYAYALDSFGKTITFSFVDKTGGGHYRFSLDRTQLAVIEGEQLDTSERIWSDFVWCVNAFGAWLFEGEMLSPAPAGSDADAAAAAGASVTVLTKVAGSGAGSSDAQPSSTPSIVIERTGGSSSATASPASTASSVVSPSAAASPTSSPSVAASANSASSNSSSASANSASSSLSSSTKATEQ